jgi:hypothetical protein
LTKRRGGGFCTVEKQRSIGFCNCLEMWWFFTGEKKRSRGFCMSLLIFWVS